MLKRCTAPDGRSLGRSPPQVTQVEEATLWPCHAMVFFQCRFLSWRPISSIQHLAWGLCFPLLLKFKGISASKLAKYITTLDILDIFWYQLYQYRLLFLNIRQVGAFSSVAESQCRGEWSNAGSSPLPTVAWKKWAADDPARRWPQNPSMVYGCIRCTYSIDSIAIDGRN